MRGLVSCAVREGEGRGVCVYHLAEICSVHGGLFFLRHCSVWVRGTSILRDWPFLVNKENIECASRTG